ncbi:MAG: hypothetical protein HKN14_11165 [Marinicaulis sp.]|nr:cytochrome c [Marinicaulis sp.]NNE41462.1 hypothetical protein [Marinicaulis sp.]NNL89201.1 hypothetical protein [Marinicaulis sp.]
MNSQTQFMAIAALALSACSQQTVNSEDAAAASPEPVITQRSFDAATGKILFVEKGCIYCHAVNGVGGKAAPALDAPGGGVIDPLDFAARMWRGAPAMIELQGIELGYSIWLEADEIANLAAFHADREVQRTLTYESVPEETRDAFLDERFWQVEDWEEFLSSGQEGEGEPAPDQIDPK